MSNPDCQQCKGRGFYYRMPSGTNPFRGSIEVAASKMRRITCHCAVVYPRQPTVKPHDPEGIDP